MSKPDDMSLEDWHKTRAIPETETIVERPILPPPSKEDLCPFCKIGKLVIVSENEPWNCEHLICDRCDSTYELDSIKLY